jgi:hypothetical protein
MRRLVRIRATTAAGVVTLGLGVGAIPALAHRGPTRSERSAIVSAFNRYKRAHRSFVAKDSKVRSIVVSTVNRHYALVRIGSASSGPARALERKGTARGARWRVIDYGAGGFSCSDAPSKVFKDLFGRSGACLPGGY